MKKEENYEGWGRHLCIALSKVQLDLCSLACCLHLSCMSYMQPNRRRWLRQICMNVYTPYTRDIFMQMYQVKGTF